MENKITLSSLSASLAKISGKSKKFCDDFLREFFRLAADNLQAGEMLKIKGFGSFKIVEVESRSSVNIHTGQPHELASYKKVVFTPAKELASAINAPFEEFESIEMEDEIPLELLEEDKSLGLSDENRVPDPILKAGSAEENEDDEITYEAYTAIEEKQAADTLPESPDDYNIEAVESPKPPIEKETETEPREEAEIENDVEPEYIPEIKSKSRFGIGFLTGGLSVLVVCLVIFMLGCFFDWWKFNMVTPEEALAQKIEQNDSKPVITEETPITEPETKPESEPVYDTVSTTRYLTTIARDHYGNFNLWPYIYLENEKILGHPDRITPGTKVVVPDLKKYGVDPKNKEDIEAAKKKGLEIYARFK